MVSFGASSQGTAMDNSFPKRIGIMFLAAFLAIVVMLIAWRLLRSGESDNARYVSEAQGMSYVLANMHYPESASFADVKGPCGWVSYTDLFGIKTAAQRYVALGPDSVLIDRNVSASRFGFVWRQFCEGVGSDDKK